MARFVRRGLLTISGTFQMNDNLDVDEIPPPSPPVPAPQPANATCQLSYTNSLNQPTVFSFPLLMNPDGSWSGTWDSTDAGPGRVEWVVFSTGGVVAATQGFFELVANDANMGVG